MPSVVRFFFIQAFLPETLASVLCHTPVTVGEMSGDVWKGHGLRNGWDAAFAFDGWQMPFVEAGLILACLCHFIMKS